MCEKYDSFLSYNKEDEMDVRRVYEYLTDIRLKIWFDLEDITPGDDWLDNMQDALDKSKTCLVFFRNEPGPWHKEEIKQALRRKVENPNFKIIPVLLPGCKDTNPQLPPMLKGNAWVDLRYGLFNIPALKKLVQAIQGGATISIHSEPDIAPTNKELPTGYKADVNKIISLLIGESLYKQRYVSIREIIQNAVDACERRFNTSYGIRPEIEIKIETKQGFFQVSDNGEGMNPLLLSECFAVIGRSIRDEENIIERTQEDNKKRLYLIAKFGIGFISTYIMAKKILISTTYEESKQINLEINGISEPFVYHSASRVGRPSNLIGTTVRVYLKDEFLTGKTGQIDILGAVKEFCRHVPSLLVIKDDSVITIKDDWNIKEALVSDVFKEQYKFELHLGISNSSINFLASNAGFLISKNPEAITPSLMPQTIGGEINLFPGIVDLNIARDTIIENDNSANMRASVSHAIKSILIKAVSQQKNIISSTLRDILMIYLESAVKYENSIISSSEKLLTNHLTDSHMKEPPPLTSTEAAELLLDTWLVSIDNLNVSFREALRKIQMNNKNRVYWHKRHINEPIHNLFRNSLIQRGFLVVKNDQDIVVLRSGQSEFTDHLAVLKFLSKRYHFELIPIEKPYEEDIESLLVNKSTLSHTTQRIIHEIEKSKGKKIRVGKLYDAPAAFNLAGYDYLNLENDLFKNVDFSSDSYDYSSLKAYILGLLQFELA